MTKKFIILYLVIFSFYSYSEKIITIDNDTVTQFSVPEYIYILEDTTGALSLRQCVLSLKNKQIKYNKNANLNFGFTKSTYWINFSIINRTDKLKNLVFSINYPRLRSIQFYEIKEIKFNKKIITGEKERFYSRDIIDRDFLFDLELEPNVVYRYYARISSEGNSLRIPMKITTYKHYIANNNFGIILYGVFMGLVILSVLFNIFLLIVSKDILNLYYVFFVTFLALFLINISGITYQYIWPNNPWLQYHSTPFFEITGNMFLLLFTSIYLNFKKNYKRIAIITKYFVIITIVLNILIIIIDNSLSYLIIAVDLISILIITLLLYVSIIELLRKAKLAIYLFLSFLSLLIGLTLYFLCDIGLVESNKLSIIGLRTGFIMQVIFFMFSIIHRYIYLKKRDSEKLENIVKLRTSALIAQKEEIETQRDKIIKQHNKTLKQKELIISKSLEIKKSFEYAMIIQDAVLPPRDELKRILNKYFVFNLPKDTLSGDFYWVTERNNRVYIAVADCTGHGVSGAMMSMLGISALNEIIGRDDKIKPSKILQELSYNIENSLHQKGEIGETKDGMDISLCMIDKITNTLLYSGSNNSLYIFRKNNFLIEETKSMKIYKYNQNNLLELKPDKIYIGYNWNKNLKFTDKKINLKKGDMLYMFSDGFVDQFGGTNKKKYKYIKFRKLLSENALLSNNSIQFESIASELYNWKGRNEQIDDILIMGIMI